MIAIDKIKCTNCTLCFHECATYVIGIKKINGNKDIFIRYPELCISCGHCLSVCPSDAVIHPNIPASSLTVTPKIMMDAVTMGNIILKRRTIRFYQNKKIPKDTIERLLNSAFNAGSGHNLQNENFIIIQNHEFIQEFEKLVIDIVWNAGLKYLKKNSVISKIVQKLHGDFFKVLSSCYKMIKYRKQNNEFKGIVTRNAPVLILAHGSKSDILSPVHCSVALRNIELLAITMNLGTCWMGFLLAAALKSPVKINKMLGLDKTRRVYGAIALGYPVSKYKYLLPRNKREVRWV